MAGVSFELVRVVLRLTWGSKRQRSLRVLRWKRQGCYADYLNRFAYQ